MQITMKYHRNLFQPTLTSESLNLEDSLIESRGFPLIFFLDKNPPVNGINDDIAIGDNASLSPSPYFLGLHLKNLFYVLLLTF